MRIACIGDVHYTSMLLHGTAKRKLNKSFYTKFFQTFFSIEADRYVCLGDFTHFGTKRQLREIFSIIRETKREDQCFEPVIGNHDILFGGKENFRQISGLPSLYRADDLEEVRLLYLDTARVAAFRKNSSYMGIEQSRWICDQLLSAEDKPVVVFAHHPCNNVRMTDSEGRYLTHMSLNDVLALKKGTAIYINGHKHRDHFHVDKNWAFLQFSDILDEPVIRVLDLDKGNLSMESVAITDPNMLRAAKTIIRSVGTFMKKKNDASFADVDDLILQKNKDESGFQLDLSPDPAVRLPKML